MALLWTRSGPSVPGVQCGPGADSALGARPHLCPVQGTVPALLPLPAPLGHRQDVQGIPGPLGTLDMVSNGAGPSSPVQPVTVWDLQPHVRPALGTAVTGKANHQ